MNQYQKKKLLPKIERVYPVLDSMLHKSRQVIRRDAFSGKTAEDFAAWKAQAAKLLGELLGLDKMEPSELCPEIDEVAELEDHIVREHLRIQTEPGVWMTAYILKPEKCGPDTPVVLCFHGHNGFGKYGVAGCYEYPEVMEKIEFYQCDYGRRLARLGYVAVCPDMRGFGERRSRIEYTRSMPEALQCECTNLAHMGSFFGVSFLGMACWDLMRLIDYILERDEWDTESLCACGFSSGGMQALYLAALDERVRGALISGYFYGIQDSLIRMNENCSCNYVPHLLEHFDMGDIASLICPRPVWIQSCKEDRLNGYRGMENVYEQMEILKKAYGCGEAEEMLHHEICPGEHRFHPEHLQDAMDFLTGVHAQEAVKKAVV